MGCLCHLVHNIASHASAALQKESGVDVEDVCVDVFYWFDKALNGILEDFCDFCDSRYREVIRYVSVRWLSLEQAINRILLLYVYLFKAIFDLSMSTNLDSQDCFSFLMNLCQRCTCFSINMCSLFLHVSISSYNVNTLPYFSFQQKSDHS